MMIGSFFFTTSWDDGAMTDIRLAHLLQKYKIPATFYVSLKNYERNLISKRELIWLSRYFEIGGHTLSHKDLTILEDDELVKEVALGKRKIEQIIGSEIKGFCYPMGKFDEKVKQVVGLSGYQYARTTELFGTMIGDKLSLPTTVHAYDHHPLIYAMHGMKRKLFFNLLKNRKFNLRWDDLALASLEYCLKNGEVFHLWGHSWEIDKNNDWNRLEKVFRVINNKTALYQRGSNGEMITFINKSKVTFYKSQDAINYDSSFNSQYFRKEYKILEKYVKNIDNKNKLVLDMGCGTGRLSSLFKKANYIGVDITANFIKFAREKYKKESVKFKVANYHAIINSKKHNADLVLFWGIFEDETNPLHIVKDVLPRVKKHGKIIFSLHNSSNKLFNIFSYFKTEWLRNNFPYSSFSYRIFGQEVEAFALNNNLLAKIFTIGLLPPFRKTVPAIKSKENGNTIVIVFEKK